MHWLAVGCGGFLGALVRYALSGWLTRKFPTGIFTANVAGCLLIGLLTALAVRLNWPGLLVRSFLIGGFLGSMTTFSTFAYQTYELSRHHSLALGSLNLFANVVIGLFAVWLGIVIGERIAVSVLEHD